MRNFYFIISFLVIASLFSCEKGDFYDKKVNVQLVASYADPWITPTYTNLSGIYEEEIGYDNSSICIWYFSDYSLIMTKEYTGYLYSLYDLSNNDNVLMYEGFSTINITQNRSNIILSCVNNDFLLYRTHVLIYW